MMTSTGLTLTLMVKSPVENDLYIAGIIFWCIQIKSSMGCLRASPDANANADGNRSKAVCRPPLKGVDIKYGAMYTKN